MSKPKPIKLQMDQVGVKGEVWILNRTSKMAPVYLYCAIGELGGVIEDRDVKRLRNWCNAILDARGKK